jgi:hypothetical protein
MRQEWWLCPQVGSHYCYTDLILLSMAIQKSSAHEPSSSSCTPGVGLSLEEWPNQLYIIDWPD